MLFFMGKTFQNLRRKLENQPKTIEMQRICSTSPGTRALLHVALNIGLRAPSRFSAGSAFRLNLSVLVNLQAECDWPRAGRDCT